MRILYRLEDRECFVRRKVVCALTWPAAGWHALEETMSILSSLDTGLYEQALRNRSMLKQDSEARRLGDLSEGDAFIDQHDRNVFADGIENLLVRAN